MIDNNPDSSQGKETKKFVENDVKGKYIPYTEKQSSFTKYEAIKYAASKDVLLVHAAGNDGNNGTTSSTVLSSTNTITVINSELITIEDYCYIDIQWLDATNEEVVKEILICKNSREEYIAKRKLVKK